jgi:hypothetical protein
MFRKTVVMAIIAILALVVLSATFGQGNASPATTENADFDGKVVCVTSGTQGNKVMEKASIKRIGTREFIVGRAVNVYDDYPEMTYWLPLNEVQAIITFKNVEDAKKALSLADKAAAQKE